MKLYKIKGAGRREEFMKILKETPGGFDVLITRGNEDYVNERKEFLSRSLFETCISTGYLTAVAAEALSFSA